MSDSSSSRTTEHWFLDLDGVRSGPYQTPEVMSLIAEGEVMPHHRISIGLKDHPWISILDWRFEQAKKPSLHEQEVKEVRSYIPESARPPAPTPEPKIEIETANASEVEAAPTHSEPDLNAWVENTPPVAPPVIEEEPAKPAPVPMPALKLEPVEHKPPRQVASEIQHTPPHRAEPEPIQEIPTQTFTAPKSKRDPMAEMFDVLQTSKQKREAKSQQAAQQQNQVHTAPEEPAAEKSDNGLTKTIGIGILITVIGFALGQVFQQSSPPNALNDAKPSVTPTAPVTKTEIIDRSTDKMTIRGKVEVPVQKPSSGQSIRSLAKPTTNAIAAPTVHSEKELEELKDLKKELQELKALKDELKNSGSTGQADSDSEHLDEFDNGNISNAEVDQGYNYYPAMPATNSGGAVQPNGYPTPQYPGQTPGQNVHY